MEAAPGNLKPQIQETKPAEREQRPIVIATMSSQSEQEKAAAEDRNRTLSQDDAAMARERLRNWQRQTTPVQPGQTD